MSRKRKTETVPAPVAISAGQRLTCEGCQALRRYPTPMCRNEHSPNYRRPVDTYSLQCNRYAVAGAVTKPPEPKPEPPPVSRAVIAGEVAKAKHNRWAIRDGVLFKPRDPEHAALMERNRARRVRA
jgi:hypothetical protein